MQLVRSATSSDPAYLRYLPSLTRPVLNTCTASLPYLHLDDIPNNDISMHISSYHKVKLLYRLWRKKQIKSS